MRIKTISAVLVLLSTFTTTTTTTTTAEKFTPPILSHQERDRAARAINSHRSPIVRERGVRFSSSQPTVVSMVNINNQLKHIDRRFLNNQLADQELLSQAQSKVKEAATDLSRAALAASARFSNERAANADGSLTAGATAAAATMNAQTTMNQLHWSRSQGLVEPVRLRKKGKS